VPAYFYIQFYKDASLASAARIVRQTLEGVASWGAHFKETRVRRIENPSKDPRHQRLGTEAPLHDYDEGCRLTVEELDEWVSGQWRARWGREKAFPETTSVFECDFEFDEEVRSKKPPVAARELKVSFWKRPDRGPVVVDIDVWEEYVLMYGRDATHRRNLLLILDLIERVYEAVRPRYGWADGEMNSNDESYEYIERGELDIRNFCVVIGRPLIDKLTGRQLQGGPYVIRPLVDGGLMVIAEHGDDNEIWKWKPKEGRWVRFEGHIGARLKVTGTRV